MLIINYFVSLYTNETDNLFNERAECDVFPAQQHPQRRRSLKRWFVYNNLSCQALTDAGYYNGQKILTPKQVTLVFDYLGEP